MTMRDIPRAEWDAFLTVGEPPSGEVTHTVVEPDRVALEKPAETDEDPQVVVHLTGGRQHWVLRLEREPLHTEA